MKRFFLFQILVIICINTIAQDGYITIKGTIYNQEDSSKILFANIYVEASSISTISDETGSFVFHIPDSLKERRLVVSSIGYYNFVKEIKDLELDNKILLQPHTYMINEVVILSDSLEPKEIVRKALKNFSKNYPKKKYYLDAFYRGLAYDQTQYLRLIEAAIGIFDFGYDSDAERARIKVLELRKSNDYVKYYKYKTILDFMFGKENALYKAYYSNPLRSEMTEFGFRFDKDFVNKYTFELQELTYLDSTLVYQIAFNICTHGPNTGNRGVLYIRLDDFAIIKIISGMYFDTAVGNRLREYLYNECYFHYNTVIFRKFEGKYYPSFIEHNGVMEDNADKEGRFQNILVVNNIYTNKDYYEKIIKKYAEKKDVSLTEQTFKYNPEFWKNYNVLTSNPLPFKVFKDLEKEKTIEKQFKENSK